LSVKFYFDEHVPRAVVLGLRLRSVDVLTAQEDGAAARSDSQMLDRATALDRVLFSQDTDLLREASGRQTAQTRFAGVIYAHPLEVTIGHLVSDLELVGLAASPEDLENQVLFLPL
jgi:hypothetical protein